MTNADLSALVARHLDDVLVDAHFADIPGFVRGKVRDNYDLPDGRRLMVATDRQSAFDRVLAAVPFKGQMLTATARFWFDKTADVVANAVLAFPDPNVTVVRRLHMLPVEVVVRDYLTGSTATSVWPMYRDGRRRMYGIDLPDGLRRNDPLPSTIVTPTTKGGTTGHDEPVSGDDIIARGLLDRRRWQEVVEAALALFARGRAVAASRGLILVDTKYEFGLDDDGQLTLADEVHTPDSSRYWRADSYAARHAAGREPENLDKEFLRLWIAERCDPYGEAIPAIPEPTLIDFSVRYIALYEAITGEAFRPVAAAMPIRDRVHSNLKAFLAG
jgi:phosphoribosylaminoimidazole-succinocarboxamide synthase